MVMIFAGRKNLLKMLERILTRVDMCATCLFYLSVFINSNIYYFMAFTAIFNHGKKWFSLTETLVYAHKWVFAFKLALCGFAIFMLSNFDFDALWRLNLMLTCAS